ncbi:MAG: hypothetical protein CM1200mP7_3590 [Chloroflexota bacterium]|nr:MAG: hypothetical protein CM1200mP7_3590 [Chloroflexota bacterium]
MMPSGFVQPDYSEIKKIRIFPKVHKIKNSHLLNFKILQVLLIKFQMIRIGWIQA